MKKLFSLTTSVGLTILTYLSFSQSVQAQNLTDRLDTPDWTRGMSVSAGFINDSMDFNLPGMSDIDSQGLLVEIANDYGINEQFVTQSALKGKMTTAVDKSIGIDNKSLGFTQRLIRNVPVGDMWLKPSLGLGIGYGEVEYSSPAYSGDQQYFSYNGELAVKFDTVKGIAPFVSYNYEIADRESPAASLTIETFMAGIAAVF